MAHLIDIRDGTERVLEVKLPTILEHVAEEGKNLQWSLLYFYGTGDLIGKSIAEFEHEVHQAPYGVLLTWKELLDLSNKFWEIYHIILVAYLGKPAAKRIDDDLTIYAKSEIVLELFDSSYWRIYAKDESVIARFQKFFKNVEIQDQLLSESKTSN